MTFFFPRTKLQGHTEHLHTGEVWEALGSLRLCPSGISGKLGGSQFRLGVLCCCTEHSQPWPPALVPAVRICSPDPTSHLPELGKHFQSITAALGTPCPPQTIPPPPLSIPSTQTSTRLRNLPCSQQHSQNLGGENQSPAKCTWIRWRNKQQWGVLLNFTPKNPWKAGEAGRARPEHLQRSSDNHLLITVPWLSSFLCNNSQLFSSIIIPIFSILQTNSGSWTWLHLGLETEGELLKLKTERRNTLPLNIPQSNLN